MVRGDNTGAIVSPNIMNLAQGAARPTSRVLVGFSYTDHAQDERDKVVAVLFDPIDCILQ